MNNCIIDKYRIHNMHFEAICNLQMTFRNVALLDWQHLLYWPARTHSQCLSEK